MSYNPANAPWWGKTNVPVDKALKRLHQHYLEMWRQSQKAGDAEAVEKWDRMVRLTSSILSLRYAAANT
jgi:hypothetical protein